MIKIGERTFYRTKEGYERFGEVVDVNPEDGRGYIILAPITSRGASQNRRKWVYVSIANAEKLVAVDPKVFEKHEYVIIDAAMNVWHSSKYAGQVAVWGGHSGWTCVPSGAQRYKTWAAATRAHANVAKRVSSCVIVTVDEYEQRRVVALEALGIV